MGILIIKDNGVSVGAKYKKIMKMMVHYKLNKLSVKTIIQNMNQLKNDKKQQLEFLQKCRSIASTDLEMLSQIILMDYDNLYNMVGEQLDLAIVGQSDISRIQIQLQDYIQRLHILINQQGLQHELQAGQYQQVQNGIHDQKVSILESEHTLKDITTNSNNTYVSQKQSNNKSIKVEGTSSNGKANHKTNTHFRSEYRSIGFKGQGSVKKRGRTEGNMFFRNFGKNSQKYSIQTIQTLLTNSNQGSDNEYQSDEEAFTLKKYNLLESGVIKNSRKMKNDQGVQVSDQFKEDIDSMNFRKSLSHNLTNSINNHIKTINCVTDHYVGTDNNHYHHIDHNDDDQVDNQVDNHDDQVDNHDDQVDNHDDQVDNHEQVQQNYIGTSFFESNSKLKLSQTLFNKTESKQIEENPQEIENLIEKKIEQHAVMEVQKLAECQNQKKQSNRLNDDQVKTSQNNIFNYIVSAKNSVDLYNIHYFIHQMNNYASQKMENNNYESNKEIAEVMEDQSMFDTKTYIQIQTFLKLYEYKQLNAEDIVEEMFKEDKQIDINTFANRLEKLFVHLEKMQDQQKDTIIRFIFETIDLEKNDKLDASEVGLCFELFFLFNNQYYHCKPLSNDTLKIKEFFSQQLQNPLIFSQNLNQQIQSLMENISQKLEKQLVTYWDLIGNRDMEECQALIRIV